MGTLANPTNKTTKKTAQGATSSTSTTTATKTPANDSASENASKRPPVVVVMGHIDHGKSTLLDYIRKTKVVAGEAGGITQHMGAYEVLLSGDTQHARKITFIDTPGHEAFQSIRARGAQVADIAILVVSAEDGVKPQTLEALRTIKEAGLPYVVAINKIDKPGANVELTKQNLAENEIYLEGYGGDISFVPISALTGQGIPELLDMIMLVADIADLKATPTVLASGVVIEAKPDSKRGISATLIIKNGHLKTGMYIVAENASSPVRILQDFTGKAITEATYSSPVRVIGFDRIPPVGAPFVAVASKKEAEEAVEKANAAAGTNSVSQFVSQFTSQNRADQKDKIQFPIILKADVVGSLDGIKHELAKIKNEKVAVKIVAESIGPINEGDLKVAQSDPNVTLIAFNSTPDTKAQQIIERSNINIKSFTIIYELIQFIKNEVASRVPKEYIEQSTGKAKIMAIFSKAKDKQIVGGKVQEGTIVVGAEVKLLRRDVEIGRGRIRELQSQKVKTSEVREGYEFGSMIESKIEIAQGDKIECFQVIEKKAL